MYHEAYFMAEAVGRYFHAKDHIDLVICSASSVTSHNGGPSSVPLGANSTSLHEFRAGCPLDVAGETQRNGTHCAPACMQACKTL